MRIVIVGNGVAGMEAAMTLRSREPSWDVTVVSEESDHFFSRTALMYVLSGQMSYQAIEPLERDVYERLRLTRVRKRVIGLDTAQKRLRMADGTDLPYDRLILACGSRPRKPDWPGYDLKGVGHFVTMQDLEWLEREVWPKRPTVDAPPNRDAHLAATTPDSPYQPRPPAQTGAGAHRPVVVGGGLVGIESVEVFLAAKRTPAFLVREEWFWPIALDPKEGAFIVHALKHHGVDVRPKANVLRLEGAGRVERVVTDQGPIEADVVVVAIGVVPNTEWLGTAVNRDGAGGIVVDGSLCTSAPDVWACGDCASVRWYDGRLRPEQLWYTARDQGRVAGRQVAGETDAAYNRGHWYNSAKLMDVEYTTAGLVNAKVPGEQSWYFEEVGAVRSTNRVVHVDGRVIGFNFLGRRWDHSILVKWLQERRSLPWVLDHLTEASFDTEFVPPLVFPKR